MEWKPYKYQTFSVEHVKDHPECGLFLEMALGKTAICLTAISDLMYKNFEVSKVLVIAPKRVAEMVWQDERDKWDHLHHLKISVIAGTERQRKEALKVEADIYTIGRDNVTWLVNQYLTRFPFDMVVIDESSSFKNPQSIRFKSLRIVRPLVKRVVILTGTPSPNGLIDLWAQSYLMDVGKRLGPHVTNFRRRYFVVGQANGHVVYQYTIASKQAEREIYRQLSDVVISMKTRDYIKLPEYVINDVKVRLTDKEQKQYDDFEEDQIMRLISEVGNIVDIPALTAAALSNKLLQFANGAVYDTTKEWHEVHQQKLDALEELIEAAQGEPMLIAYSFQHDVIRILKRVKGARFLRSREDFADWDKGKIQVAVTHPASTGHGLNLQHGGHILTWFGQTWSLEMYDQLNARLRRPGQKAQSLVLNRILTAKTMDYDVMRALRRKASGQEALMEAIKARIRKYRS